MTKYERRIRYYWKAYKLGKRMDRLYPWYVPGNSDVGAENAKRVHESVTPQLRMLAGFEDDGSETYTKFGSEHEGYKKNLMKKYGVLYEAFIRGYFASFYSDEKKGKKKRKFPKRR